VYERVDQVVVEVNKHNLDCTQRVLQARTSGGTGAAETSVALRQAVADTDWDTVESHGGFNAVVEEILKWEQENRVPKGRGSIDDFRLRGSRTWRRRGGPFTKRGGPPRWCTKWRTLLTTTTLHSQRASPRCCGRGLAWKALLEAGWHGFRASAATR